MFENKTLNILILFMVARPNTIIKLTFPYYCIFLDSHNPNWSVETDFHRPIYKHLHGQDHSIQSKSLMHFFGVFATGY